VVVVSGRPYALGGVHERAAALVQAFMPGERGAVGSIVAAAAAVVLLTLPDANGAVGPSTPVTTPPATSASASAPAAGATTPAAPADPGAPSDVKLRDNRDSVTLSWHYPKGSEGPVLISGGRAGQPQRAFQQLPSGTNNYVVYGLNDAQNYCFTIAVAYSTDHIANSSTVCTKR